MGKLRIQCEFGRAPLWRHRGEIVSYDDLDFRAMAQKSALLNSTAALYADVSQDWQTLADVEVGLERLFLAVQLIDDLVDWESDLTSSIYTYPLCLAYARLSTLSPAAIGAELLRGNIADVIIQEATAALTEARRVFLRFDGTVILSLIDHLILSLSHVSCQISDDAAGIMQCPSDYDIRKYIRTIIDPRLAH